MFLQPTLQTILKWPDGRIPRCRTQPFGGTSAAAPQAAGLAALWWSKHLDWTAGQVKQAMRDSALDLGPPGHDYETGYGMLKLP